MCILNFNSHEMWDMHLLYMHTAYNTIHIKVRCSWFNDVDKFVKFQGNSPIEYICIQWPCRPPTSDTGHVHHSTLSTAYQGQGCLGHTYHSVQIVLENLAPNICLVSSLFLRQVPDACIVDKPPQAWTVRKRSMNVIIFRTKHSNYNKRSMDLASYAVWYVL